MCGFILITASVLQQTGVKDTGAGVAGFITSLYVVIVPIFGMVLGRKTTLKNWFCTLLAIGGVFLISYTNGGFSSGDIFVFLCACAFACHIIAVDIFSPGCDGVRMSFVQFITGAIVSLPLMLVLEKPSVSEIMSSAIPILYLGIMSSGIAYTLQILGQKRTVPAVASIIMSLESVFALIGGFLFNNENMSGRKILGCIIVFISVIITQIEIKSLFRIKEISKTDKTENTEK